MATPSSAALTPIAPIGSSPPVSFRPTIATPPLRPSNGFAANIEFTPNILRGRVQDAFKGALEQALAQTGIERKNALDNLGLRASEDPRGGFIVEAINGSTIAEFIQSSGQIGGLKKVAINAPPFIDPRIEFNDDVIARWGISPEDTPAHEKQALFKAHLEQILRDTDESARNSALQALGLKAEMRDFRGVAGWHIEDIRNVPGWFGNNIKHGYFGTHKPIAKMNGQELVRVPAGSTPHLAPRQIADPNLHPHSPENLKALAKDALDRGRMMDLGTKGAYVLLPDCASAIIIPSGSGEDDLDYSKIRIVQFMNSDTGEKITNDTILKNAVETLMDCQSEIDKLTNGGNFWITIGTDINGQLMIKVIPNRKNDLVLDLKDITDTGEEVSISGELQKAYSNRLEKGCSGVPKKKKSRGLDPFDDTLSGLNPAGKTPSKKATPFPPSTPPLASQAELERMQAERRAKWDAEQESSSGSSPLDMHSTRVDPNYVPRPRSQAIPPVASRTTPLVVPPIVVSDPSVIVPSVLQPNPASNVTISSSLMSSTNTPASTTSVNNGSNSSASIPHSVQNLPSGGFFGTPCLDPLAE